MFCVCAAYCHRDVKPSNILINALEGQEEGERHTRLLIADFSSAVSDEVLARGLYGERGPSVDEVCAYINMFSRKSACE
jgi:serine/threonine protein kinase